MNSKTVLKRPVLKYQQCMYRDGDPLLNAAPRRLLITMACTHKSDASIAFMIGVAQTKAAPAADAVHCCNTRRKQAIAYEHE